MLSSDPFFPTFISGIERALSDLGNVAGAERRRAGRARAETYRSLIETGRVDGVALTAVRDSTLHARADEHRTPTPSWLGRLDASPHLPMLECPTMRRVGSWPSTWRARTSSRRIVAGPPQMLHAARWRDSLSEALDTAERPQRVETDFSAERGVDATRERLAQPSRRDRDRLCANDHMALAELGHPRRAGIDVPRELSIAGYGDSDRTRSAYPSLTTAAADVAEWGYRAAKLLMQQVRATNDTSRSSRQLVRRSASRLAEASAMTATLDRGASTRPSWSRAASQSTALDPAPDAQCCRPLHRDRSSGAAR